MVHSKTNYIIWKDIQEENHLADYFGRGFTHVSFPVAHSGWSPLARERESGGRAMSDLEAISSMNSQL